MPTSTNVRLRAPHLPSFWGVPGSLVELTHEIYLKVDDSFRRLVVPGDDKIECDEPAIIRETFSPEPERRARGLRPFVSVPTACWVIEMLLDGPRYGEPARLITTGANVLRISDVLVKMEFHFGERRTWQLSAAEPSQMTYPPGQIKFIEPA